MSDYTDDDVTAAADAIYDSGWWRVGLSMDNCEQIARLTTDAVAPAIAARARRDQLDEAWSFAREYEDQWGGEPAWWEIAGHLARAEQVNSDE